jgi:hypothetical protein
MTSISLTFGDDGKSDGMVIKALYSNARANSDPNAHSECSPEDIDVVSLARARAIRPGRILAMILLCRHRLQPTLTFQPVLQILKPKQEYRPQKR